MYVREHYGGAIRAFGGAPRQQLAEHRDIDRNRSYWTARRWCVCQTQPTVDPEGDITANTTTDGCITECKEDRSRRAAHLLDAFCLGRGRGQRKGDNDNVNDNDNEENAGGRENDECDEE